MSNADKTLGSLFIVDDEAQLLLALMDMLKAQGYAVQGFASGPEALGALQAEKPDLLLTDLMMPGMDGIALLKAALEIDPALMCLLMTGQGTVQTAVDAMRAGAFDYILKPFKLGVLLPTLARAMAVRAMRQENVDLKATVAMHELGEALARSLNEQEILDKLAAAALAQCGASEATVLLPASGPDSVVVVSAAGEGSEARVGQILRVADGVSGWKARHQAPVVHEFEEHDLTLHPGLSRSGAQACACLPILGAGVFVGVLTVSVWGVKHALSQGQLRALQVLCKMAGAAIENARLFGQVQEAEAKYRTITENITDLVSLTDPGGTYHWANPAHKKVLGYDPEDLLEASIFSLVHPEDLSILQERQRLLKAGDGTLPFACRFRHADGHFLSVEGNSTIVLSEDGLAVAAVHVAHDVTERKRAEEEIRGYAGQYKAMLSASLFGFWLVDEKGKLLDANDAYCKMSGYTRKELLSLSIPDLECVEKPENTAEHIKKISKAGTDRFESKHKRKDGRVFDVEISVNFWRSQGKFVVFISDITERRKAEADRVLLSTAIEQAHDSVFVTDPQGTILYVNPAACASSGYAREELLGANPRILKSGLHPREFYEEMWSTIQAGNPWHGRVTDRRKDGSLYSLDAVITPVTGAEGSVTGFIATRRDITQTLLLEEQLEGARKLETIGMITNGVAHEVRNPLNAINILSAVLEKKQGEDPDVRQCVAHIKEQVERLSILMNDLLVLGRPTDPRQFASCEVESLVCEAVAHIEAGDHAAKGRIVLDASGGGFSAKGIPAKLVQVFINILSNALSFSPAGEVVRIVLEPEEEWVKVTVADRGPGIPEKLLPKLFQPFQSQRKGGTGLGLAIVQKTVADHGGTVSAVNNDPGPGACFTVRLPLEAR